MPPSLQSVPAHQIAHALVVFGQIGLDRFGRLLSLSLLSTLLHSSKIHERGPAIHPSF